MRLREREREGEIRILYVEISIGSVGKMYIFHGCNDVKMSEEQTAKSFQNIMSFTILLINV